MSLQAAFPNLVKEGFEITSPPDHRYNCIAFAADDTKNFWWPEKKGFWPAGVPRSVTLDSFTRAYATLGYETCSEGHAEDGFEKIVIYTEDGSVASPPTHAAKLAPDGRWKSKLGQFIDIHHNTISGVEGPKYGKAAIFMRRGVKK
jgi:hypothetical protein